MKNNEVLNLLTDETVNEVLQSISELPEDSTPTYEVWALGYDEDAELTDIEILLGEYTNPDDAIQFAATVCLSNIKEQFKEDGGNEESLEKVACFSVEVETVVEDKDDEDGGTMNIGTVYARTVYVADLVLSLRDFEIIETGELKIKTQLLKDFNKNDTLYIDLDDAQPNTQPLSCTIISKVIYDDGEYYHLRLNY